MPNELSSQAQLLATAMAGGTSLAAWCRSTKTNERTARRWASTPEFKALVAELREEVVKEAVAKLSTGTVKAVEVLMALLKSKDERVRLRAATAILDGYASLDMYSDVRARLAALEATSP